MVGTAVNPLFEQKLANVSTLTYTRCVDSARPFKNRSPAIRSSSVRSNLGVAARLLGSVPEGALIAWSAPQKEKLEIISRQCISTLVLHARDMLCPYRYLVPSYEEKGTSHQVHCLVTLACPRVNYCNHCCIVTEAMYCFPPPFATPLWRVPPQLVEALSPLCEPLSVVLAIQIETIPRWM